VASASELYVIASRQSEQSNVDLEGNNLFPLLDTAAASSSLLKVRIVYICFLACFDELGVDFDWDAELNALFAFESGQIIC